MEEKEHITKLKSMETTVIKTFEPGDTFTVVSDKEKLFAVVDMEVPCDTEGGKKSISQSINAVRCKEGLMPLTMMGGQYRHGAITVATNEATGGTVEAPIYISMEDQPPMTIATFVAANLAGKRLRVVEKYRKQHGNHGSSTVYRFEILESEE